MSNLKYFKCYLNHVIVMYSHNKTVLSENVLVQTRVYIYIYIMNNISLREVTLVMVLQEVIDNW